MNPTTRLILRNCAVLIRSQLRGWLWDAVILLGYWSIALLLAIEAGTELLLLLFLFGLDA